jgi:photosystem II stability/assembly factor-like uncharacterized protein
MDMYWLLITLLLFLLLQSETVAQWLVISNQGNEAVSFPTASTGYSTANGITKKTTNGGFNWSSLSGGNLTGIFFINDLTGWVVGYPGYIGKTINGSSFVQQPTGVTDRLNDVFFINDNTGWVVGGDFSVERIFKTTNGGTNWTPQSSGTANKMFSVYFIDANTGWSVGGPSSPKIIKTTNGGDNWNLQYTTVNTPLYSVMFADANTGWAVAGYLGGETIIKTTNGGTNWFSQSSGDNRYLRECYVINSNKAFAVGQSGKVIITTNGGDNWIVQNTGSSIELWSIDFANDTVGYAIGSNVVLKTTNGGITFVNRSGETPAGYELYQNFPNPFNGKSKIKYQITRKEFVELKIYDASGNEITTLFSKSQLPGSYEISWEADGYPSGVYFYRLETSGQIETKKMILIK